jgi:hypothetical protein
VECEHSLQKHCQKNPHIAAGIFRKCFLDAIDQNPKFLDIAAFLHFGIVQSMAKNHASNDTINLH